jgi:hypothetical protein
MLVLLLLGAISSAFGQSCQTYFQEEVPAVIRLPSNDIVIAVTFDWALPKGLTVTGGAGLAVSNDTRVVNITSFGDVVSATNNLPDGSPASQVSAFSSLYYLAALVGTLGVVGIRRVEPVLLLLLCVGIFSIQASSVCTPSIKVNGYDSLIFNGDVTSRLLVTCPGGGVAIKVTNPVNGLSSVRCPWSARFTKAWASPTNDPSCEAAAPLNVAVDAGSTPGSIRINNLPELSRITTDFNLLQTMRQGVPLQEPASLYSGVRVAAGSASLDVLLQRVDVQEGGNTAIFPVSIKSGSNICKFGYKCTDGSCLRSIRSSSSNQCVEYGYEPAPTACADRGNTTGGMNCGFNCTSLTCTTMCPNYDCTAARPCETPDFNAYPCHQCQCPATCNNPQASNARSLELDLCLLVVSFTAGFLI